MKARSLYVELINDINLGVWSKDLNLIMLQSHFAT